MQKKNVIILAIFSVILTVSLCFGITQRCTYQQDKKPNYYENKTAAPYIPETMKFAGENVPMELYWVRESLDKELLIVCYQHSKTLQIFKRSGRFFPVIEKILKEEGLPEDFKYLCVAESGLDNNVSSAKAAGFWQFMESTGRMYGLEIRDDVDERYHLEKATRAAAKYLKKEKNLFGSWSLAAASYNVGESGLMKSVTAQSCNDYWNLHLNTETSRYLYRILAYKLLFENPRIYGINLCKADLYCEVPGKEVEVADPNIDVIDFAKKNDVSYKEVRLLNPWIRGPKFSTAGKKYAIQIPKKSGCSYKELYHNLENPFFLLGDTIFHEE